MWIRGKIISCDTGRKKNTGIQGSGLSGRKIRAIVILLAAILLCMPGILNTGTEMVAAGSMKDAKKIAITFDDDVIIGLSQEISCKEAVSMI